MSIAELQTLPRIPHLYNEYGLATTTFEEASFTKAGILPDLRLDERILAGISSQSSPAASSVSAGSDDSGYVTDPHNYRSKPGYCHPRRSKGTNFRPPSLPDQEGNSFSFVKLLICFSTGLVASIWPLSEAGGLPLLTFVSEALRRSKTSYSTLQVALYYLVLLKQHVPPQDFTRPQSQGTDRLAMQCGRRMFLASMILAAKYLQDKNYSTSAWETITGLDAPEINKNERLFLQALDYKLHITKDAFQDWARLVNQICLHNKHAQAIHTLGVTGVEKSREDWGNFIRCLSPDVVHQQNLREGHLRRLLQDSFSISVFSFPANIHRPLPPSQDDVEQTASTVYNGSVKCRTIPQNIRQLPHSHVARALAKSAALKSSLLTPPLSRLPSPEEMSFPERLTHQSNSAQVYQLPSGNKSTRNSGAVWINSQAPSSEDLRAVKTLLAFKATNLKKEEFSTTEVAMIASERPATVGLSLAKRRISEAVKPSKKRRYPSSQADLQGESAEVLSDLVSVRGPSLAAHNTHKFLAEEYYKTSRHSQPSDFDSQSQTDSIPSLDSGSTQGSSTCSEIFSSPISVEEHIRLEPIDDLTVSCFRNVNRYSYAENSWTLPTRDRSKALNQFVCVDETKCLTPMRTPATRAILQTHLQGVGACATEAVATMYLSGCRGGSRRLK